MIPSIMVLVIYINLYLFVQKSSLAAQINNLPATQEMQVRSVGQEDPLEKEMEAHSSIPACRIPMDRGAWRAANHGISRVGHDLATKPTPPFEQKDMHINIYAYKCV